MASWHGLVGYADHAAVEERLGELRSRSQVEIGEEDLIVTEQRILLGKRLLDLDDHLRLGIDSLRSRADLGPGGSVFGIGDAGPLARRSLDEHRMPVLDQALDARRHHGYPVLVVLDFFRNPNDHARPPVATSS